MKGFLQEASIIVAALYASLYMYSGLTIQGGFWSIFTASILLTIGFKIIRPILNIMTLPLNVITFGLFQVLTISFIVFLVSLIYPQLQIRPFEFEGLQFLGIIIQRFHVNLFLSYIIISGTIYLITKAFFWLFDL
jgi:putative membrane protein